MSQSMYAITVFTWLNAAASITNVVKLDAATIQGWLLFEGGVYYTKPSSMHYYSIIIIWSSWITSECNYVSVLEHCFNMHSYTLVVHTLVTHVSYTHVVCSRIIGKHISCLRIIATHISCSLYSLNKYNLSHGRHNVDMQLQLKPHASNKSHSIYSRATFITIIVACIAITNQGWLLFAAWRLTK